MGDVLSQNEIDSLLAALSTGELDVEEIKDSDEKQVKEYGVLIPCQSCSCYQYQTKILIFCKVAPLLLANFSFFEMS